MKRTLLISGSLLLLAGAEHASAQLALENFNAGLPSTWSMIKVDANIPSSGLNAVIVSELTTKAWMTRLRATGDSCMLTTSSFTTAAKADRWLLSPSFMVTDPKMILQWVDAEGVG